MVKEGGEELVDEPAVTAVDHYHFETCSLCVCSSVSISLNDLVDHFLSEFLYFHAVSSYAC
mgnify:CR=1 FL=1